MSLHQQQEHNLLHNYFKIFKLLNVGPVKKIDIRVSMKTNWLFFIERISTRTLLTNHPGVGEGGVAPSLLSGACLGGDDP